MKNHFTLLIVLAITYFSCSNIISAQLRNENYTASINGKIIIDSPNHNIQVKSENGSFWCTFDIGAVTDEYRELSNFRLYKEGRFLFGLSKVPGSDLEISNSGYVIFYDHKKHFLGELKIHAYSVSGNHLFTKSFFNADQFEFSESGNIFGIVDKHNLNIINIPMSAAYSYEKCEKFALDNAGYIVVLNNNELKIYRNDRLLNSIKLECSYIRKIIISSENNLIALINKRNFITYKLSDGRKSFSKQLKGNLSFRDIKILDAKIIVGIHKKTKNESIGILREYDISGKLVDERFGESKLIDQHEKAFVQKTNKYEYDPIPWPFFPFDSMRTVWNHYEQQMGNDGGEWSYLHQGLDLIVPIAEETYSVTEGIVKLVLTLGGGAYWRIAVSDSLVDDYSNGWLYAHLIENTIQFDIGDTVYIHDYLGDIIQWSEDWGHIHFVEIRDSGLVWLYDDNEWGINFNPMLALTPLPDTTAPYIDTVFTNSKFGFCENETSNYLSPDSLYGEVDIICKVVDYAGNSEWQQPAFKTYYWVINTATGDTIQPRQLGHVLNHSYPFYSGDHYTPFSEVMYKRDPILAASSWMSTERNYYHILTNSNGDSLIDLNERYLAFNTENYLDGYYVIFIEVFDEAGNSALDSMSVQFKNGNSTGIKNENLVSEYSLAQNYPNPFNPTTKIKFTIPQLDPIDGGANNGILYVTLKIYDTLGKEVMTVVDEQMRPGENEIEIYAGNLASGVYYYQLQAGNPSAGTGHGFIDSKKMIVLK
ncbi:MAG: T9SS type A sorting domain-containing protein [Ignavibacteriae bacterium]|nr:T9SS type A sorting domain-containing protein [Ignavibacteriota bacterium]